MARQRVAPAGAAGRPVSRDWDEVVLPDLISNDLNVIGGDGYSMATATGELTTAHVLPSYNPGRPDGRFAVQLGSRCAPARSSWTTTNWTNGRASYVGECAAHIQQRSLPGSTTMTQRT